MEHLYKEHSATNQTYFSNTNTKSTIKHTLNTLSRILSHFQSFTMGYTEIDNSKNAVQLAWAAEALYRRDRDGSIWRWDYSYPYNKNWTSVTGPDSLDGIIGTKDFLYKYHTDGKLFRFLGHQNEWIQVHDYGHIRSAIASDASYYYILNDGRVAVDGMMHPLQSYADLKKLYDALLAQDKADKSEIASLKSAKSQDEKTIQQLKEAIAAGEKKERDLQDKIVGLEKSLATAQAGEAKLTSELDTEKKKEYDEWKKFEIHDAEDHKALAEAQARAAELQKKVDDVEKDIRDSIIPDLQKTIVGLKNDISGHEALIEILKKHEK
ncbi:hypothetical protein B0T10DRAFT_492915 [Thelonectria olida]|uniref:Uncharacterized protein n=1 Tax=Thelonectria olida TaxID=1576542 RepID=A0A9P9APN2_9HYPO|nr:hypothetical protein B0T10DRAFT_492915 [Thelonectria olida]